MNDIERTAKDRTPNDRARDNERYRFKMAVAHVVAARAAGYPEAAYRIAGDSGYTMIELFAAVGES